MNKLGYEPIVPMVLRISLLSMLAQFVNVFYSIVDRMFVGRIPDVGYLCLGGIGICGPIVTMIGSFAFLVGIGGSPMMGIKMGEQNKEEAKHILCQSFGLMIMIAVMLILCLYPLSKTMIYCFGASDVLFPYAIDYFRIYLSGTVFSLLAVSMNQFIIAQGYAKEGMISVWIGAICNILFDPLFIFVFDLGVKGAAIATVLSQMLSCFYVLYFLFKKSEIKLEFEWFDIKIMKKIIVMGFTPFIIIAIDNVMIMSMNSLLNLKGGHMSQYYMTANTIVQSFMLILTMPLGGISAGTQCILSYNYGAKNMKRVKDSQKLIILLCALYALIMFICARVFTIQFIQFFTLEKKVIVIASAAIIKSTLFIIPLGIQYAIVDGFKAMGKVNYALPLSFFRKSIYFISLYVFAYMSHIDNIFYAEALCDIIGPIVTIVIYIFSINKILNKRKEEPAIE